MIYPNYVICNLILLVDLLHDFRKRGGFSKVWSSQIKRLHIIKLLLVAEGSQKLFLYLVAINNAVYHSAVGKLYQKEKFIISDWSINFRMTILTDAYVTA